MPPISLARQPQPASQWQAVSAPARPCEGHQPDGDAGHQGSTHRGDVDLGACLEGEDDRTDGRMAATDSDTDPPRGWCLASARDHQPRRRFEPIWSGRDPSPGQSMPQRRRRPVTSALWLASSLRNAVSRSRRAAWLEVMLGCRFQPPVKAGGETAWGDVMSKPTILTVDDDPMVSAAITRDLSNRYGADYRIVRASSGAQALAVLAELALRDEPVALIAADQRMPQMTGVEMLEQARVHAPGAKFLLLTAYADTDVAIKAINDIGLDYYLLKPWDPPEDRLYPVIDDLLGDWQQANPEHTSDVRVIGHRWSDRSHEIKSFLARNYVPYRWYDIERDAEGQRLRDLAGATASELPLVLIPEGETLRAPSTLDLAGALGLRTRAEQPLYDVCIVGGGPAGLAAAVYSASEGLSTVIVEREAPGGQAGQSASIENYLGFPKGLTGSDLTQRAIAQVSRFGAEMVLARDVAGLETRGPVRAVLFDGSGEIEARALIVASGVCYRRLQAA